MEAFNTGLEPHDPEQARLLRQAYANWLESVEKRKADPAPHQQWIKFVLSKTLELDEQILAEGQAIPQTLQAEIPEHHELLRPNIVLIDPNTKKPRLLVQIYPRSQELTSYVTNSRWKASPDTRMTELLHATGVRLGIVTNGEHWMLVDAPKGETSGYSSWYAALWLEEKLTLQAFKSLLSASRFFNVPDDQTLEALLTKSASNQQEVTDQLGYQVRRAVEVLIHSLDRADQDFSRELLAGVQESVLYESALTVMMRLVFLFCAEERELIPSKPFPVYEQNYSVSTISKQLRELADQHGEELLERRYDAWPRLLAAFRAVYGGLRHDDVHIPAYGGSLFNPDRFPFLEGRKMGTTWRDGEANPLPVNNRTVLHLLEALQLLQIKMPGGGPAEARRLSFRALDIEQIGHVYEGLLDHTAKRATEPILGLTGTRAKEPEIPLAELEKLLAKGETDLVKYLKDETGKTEKALAKMLKTEIEPANASRFRTVCQSDDALWTRVQPLAGIVRLDNFGYPVVIPTGSVFVTAGTDRRSSGTHYTPRLLTEPIVQHTLEPLVYFGPAEGWPKSEWKLKSAKELLDLKICDMACGSGAFLVQVCRYLAARLLEAWDEIQQANPGQVRYTPEGLPSTGQPGETLIPDDVEERRIYALRLVSQRCIYGVDINPLAVEMCKLSLWLLTLAKDKPFEFLDHNIRCGDSLVGIHDLEQLSRYSLKPNDIDQPLFSGPWLDGVDEAIALRLKLEDLPANSVEDVGRQEKLLEEANEKIARLRCAADLLVSAEFWGESAKDKLERVRHAAVKSGHYIEHGPTAEFEQIAAKERRGQKMFHWPLEFPEVIVKRGGFDGFVGNPPFLNGFKIGRTFGESYRHFIDFAVADNAKGSADYCVYFLLTATDLLAPLSTSGFLATKSVAQGDSRKVGLDRIVESGFTIYRATDTEPWPGGASVEIAKIWFTPINWAAECILRNLAVTGITSSLNEKAVLFANPFRLNTNTDKAFKGITIGGTGFVLESAEAHNLITQDGRNADVVKPYLIGKDINTSFDQGASRWIIDFGVLDYSEAATYSEPMRIVTERVKPYRDQLEGQVHEADFWKFQDKRIDSFNAIAHLSNVFAIALTSKTVSPALASTTNVLDQSLVIFKTCQYAVFSAIASSLHYWWVITFGTPMRTDARYLIRQCFETFPFPSCCNDLFNRAEDSDDSELTRIGRKYHSYRKAAMKKAGQGLTKIYNRFHNPEETLADILKLRELHVEMDQAVAAAYGWTDLELGHDFHETKHGVRFTISEAARREVLQRLLKLNHERYAEEVKQGLHGKKASAKTVARKKAPRQPAPKKKTPSSSNAKQPNLFDFGVEQESGNDVWYFAYGSNLSIDRKQLRTGQIRQSQRAVLPNYRLAFNKQARDGGVYANLVQYEGAKVWGVIYLCSPNAIEELDRREGVMGGDYVRVPMTVNLDDGTKCSAQTYVAGNEFIVAEGTPTDEYLGYILTGATEHGLPKEYINSLRRIAKQLDGDK
jgi:cation transport regulator ChaC